MQIQSEHFLDEANQILPEDRKRNDVIGNKSKGYTILKLLNVSCAAVKKDNNSVFRKKALNSQ